jgi:hypothetical protein
MLARMTFSLRRSPVPSPMRNTASMFHPPNDPVVKLRGQGPRAEAAAARRVPACEARDAGAVTPSR